ncbi:MAG: ABC transporter permease [Acidobacteria bacterium]|nr:ABC transporter permease [Acidobacteriota bacterium]
MKAFSQNVRYALRLLRKEPGFSIVAVLTLAVGIGGATSMFSIVDAVLLQPLPYTNASQLFSFSNTDKDRGLSGIDVSFTRFERLQQNTRLLSSVAAYFPSSVTLSRSGELPDQITSAQVTRSFFELLGVSTALGREFLPQEDSPAGPAVAILSARFWHSRFAGDPEIVGRAITIGGQPTVIVGILPESFRFPLQQPEPEIWMPRVFENPTMSPAKVHSGAGYLQVIARAKEGTSVAALESEVRVIDAGYKKDFPAFADSTEDLVPAPLSESLTAGVREPLFVLLTATLGVLLIGCTNLMNLVLTRANARRREIAIRVAIGASRTQVISQFLTETLVLALTGAVLGVLLAQLLHLSLRLLPPGTLPRSEEVGLHGDVLLFAVFLAVLSAVLAGLLPSLRAFGRAVQEGLTEGSRSASSTRRTGRARAALVAAEVGIAVLLLSGSAVLIKSLSKLMNVDPGFNASNLLTMSINFPGQRYSSAEQELFIHRLVDSVNAIPRLRSAAVNALPLVGGGAYMYFCPENWPCKGIGRDPVMSLREVTPDYFRVMRIPLVRGRSFDDHDDRSGRKVAIVNEAAASRFFQGQDPVGKWIANSRDMQPMLIVGLAKDVKISSLQSPAFQEVYTPHQQAPLQFPTMTLIVRSDAVNSGLIQAVKQKVAELDPGVAVNNISMMKDLVSDSIAEPRLTTGLGFLFAVLAVLLTVIGIYGVLAYSVSQRRQEIGIRMALGATPRQVIRRVLIQGVGMIGCGLIAGFVGSLALNPVLKSLLFGISPRDPMSLAATLAVVFLVALIACYIPARRAARTNPSLVLQSQ